MKRTSVLPLATALCWLVAGCAGDKSGSAPLTPEEIMALPDARMRSIVLTEVELTNATIEDVARYLTEQSKQADPDRKGVLIQYRNFQVQDIPWRVNVRLPQGTVLQVLEEACRQTRCSYMVAKDAVTVMPAEYFRKAAPVRR